MWSNFRITFTSSPPSRQEEEKNKYVEFLKENNLTQQSKTRKKTLNYINACGHVCRYVDRKRLGCHADLYTVRRCRTRGESQEFIAHRQQSTQARDPPWLCNPEETSPEIQNRSISGPTKRTYVLQKIFKKKTKTKKTPLNYTWTLKIYYGPR